MKNMVLTEQSIILPAHAIDENVLRSGEFPNSDNYYKISITDDVDVLLSGNKKDSHVESLPLIIIDKTFFDILDSSVISDALFEIQSLVIIHCHYTSSFISHYVSYIPSSRN